MKFFVKWVSTNEATSRAGSTARVPVFDSRTADEKPVCIDRKVLRPANWSKNFRDFLAPTAKAQLASKIHFVRCVSQAAVQTLEVSSKLSPHSTLKFLRTFTLDSPNSAQILKLLSAA
jgi:hypothetical protein